MPLKNKKRDLFRVVSYKKMKEIILQGFIKPPVRAWIDISEALRFSRQTGRMAMVRIKDNGCFKQLEGHKGKAVISYNTYFIGDN